MDNDRDPSYLSDGVYVSHDGFQLWLAVNNHENKVIALEPAVLGQLIDYAKSINEKYGRKHFPV